jgi:hypothetical protein
MSAETPTKKRSWGLRIAGLVVLCGAGVLAATGILERRDSAAKLTDWTNA